VLAAFFKVSLDELFDFDVNNVDKEIEEIRLEFNKYFWGNFEKAEQILLNGLKTYPASVQLKTELFELYAYNVVRGDEIINKAFELGSHIISVSQDIFCTCRTKANMIHIYKCLELERNQDHYEEIKKIIETLPYMYPYMLQDKMRLSASHIKGEEGMKEAKTLKDIEWQEFFIACSTVGRRYWEMEDYENALKSLQESVDVIERFMYPDKLGYDAYPIGGTQANHAITTLEIAACMFRLGRTDGIDALIEKANGETPAYRGDAGICPDCHSVFLEKRADGWYCPQCLTKATLDWVDGDLKVTFTPEEMAKNRWSPWGQELHDNNIRKGHGKAAVGKDIIAAKRKEYAEYKDAVKLPELIKE
jgi:tetratricopeptide (TPR) repeat protein